MGSHASSRRPGRRKDDDFIETVMSKLTAALVVAEAGSLVPIILGDLLDAGDDGDIRMLTLITRVLRSCWCRPWYLISNHTLTIRCRSIHKDRSDGHPLTLFAESGTLRLMVFLLIGSSIKQVIAWLIPVAIILMFAIHCVIATYSDSSGPGWICILVGSMWGSQGS
jgi:hypothetical protein